MLSILVRETHLASNGYNISVSNTNAAVICLRRSGYTLYPALLCLARYG